MKKSLALMLALIMVLCMLPTTALAAMNTGHKIDVTFKVLYVSDEFNLGYNYGASEKLNLCANTQRLIVILPIITTL